MTIPPRLTQAEYIAFLDSLPVQPSSLFFASKDGNVEEVMRILSNNPTLDVKWRDESEESETALHVVCAGGRDSIVSILLAHPNVDVNATDKYGCTPFMSACERGHTSCARLMLRDSRVKVNEPDNGKRTTLFRAAATSRLNVIRWWIASGREIDLGKPGDVDYTDAIGMGEKNGKTEVVTLLERFKENPVETRHAMRLDIRWYDEAAVEMFAQGGLCTTANQRHHYHSCSQVLLHCRPASSGTPNGAVLSSGRISQGDHPRQRQ